MDPGAESESLDRLRAMRGSARRGRVLHVVASSLVQRQIGYTLRTQAVATCQRHAGLDPRVVVRSPASGDSAASSIDGILYHHAPAPMRDEGPDDRMARVVEACVPILDEFRPAVLHAASDFHQAQVALALGRATGIPVVYEVRGFWEESWLSGQGVDEARGMATDRFRMIRAAETAAMRAVDAVVTLGQTMRDEIVARGVAADVVTVVPNAVDPVRFQPRRRDPGLAAALGIAPGDVVAGYISSFSAYEGIPVLVEAVAQARRRRPQLRLLLVGDGEEMGEIRRVVERSLGSAAILTGTVPHEQAMAYHAMIDIFVVPRTAHRVSRLVTPLKPFEALAMARAVVVSDLPALREVVIPGETGMVFPAGDAQALALVIDTLAGDPALRSRLGHQAREWILRERTWTANGVLYRRLFEDLGSV